MSKTQAPDPALVFVPRDPTPEMVKNALKECGGIGGGSCGEHTGVDADDMRAVWDAMLAAAPIPALEGVGLTDEQIHELIEQHAGYGGDDIRAVVRAAIAAARAQRAAPAPKAAPAMTHGQARQLLQEMADAEQSAAPQAVPTQPSLPPRIIGLLKEALREGWQDGFGRSLKDDLELALGLRAAPAPQAAPEWPCTCDDRGIGVPGVSCGDCPRDYGHKVKHPKQRPPIHSHSLRPSKSRCRLSLRRSSTTTFGSWQGSHQHPLAAPTDERAAFEAAVKVAPRWEGCVGWGFERTTTGSYCNAVLSALWNGWMLRAALANTTQPDPLQELTESGEELERLISRPTPLEQLESLRQMLQSAVDQLKARGRVALTDEQIEAMPMWALFVGLWPATRLEIVRAIERAHGIHAPKDPKA